MASAAESTTSAAAGSKEPLSVSANVVQLEAR